MKPGTYARFETSLGNFTIELFDSQAPNTVANFVGLADGTKEWKDPKSGQPMKGKPFYAIDPSTRAGMGSGPVVADQWSHPSAN